MDSNLETVTEIVDSCNTTLRQIDAIESAVVILRRMVIMSEGRDVLDSVIGSVTVIRNEQLRIKALF